MGLAATGGGSAGASRMARGRVRGRIGVVNGASSAALLSLRMVAPPVESRREKPYRAAVLTERRGRSGSMEPSCSSGAAPGVARRRDLLLAPRQRAQVEGEGDPGARRRIREQDRRAADLPPRQLYRPRG